MKILVAKDESTAIKKAAQFFLETALSSVKERGQFTVALSGGTTPLKFYSLLADDFYRSKVPWQKTYVFWGDERCVPSDHPDSNYRLAKETLLGKVPLPESHIFRMAGEMTPPLEAARSYENNLRSHFKVSLSLPKFDLIHLGVGEDGHTASLFPRTEALKEKNHWVVANYVEKYSSNRLTFTFPLINNARKILILCKGSSKAKIVRDMLRTDFTPHGLPLQQVELKDGEVLWIMDSSAASLMTSEAIENATHV